MILTSLVVFTVMLAAIVFAAAKIFQAAVSRLVLERHRDLEEIMETDDVPSAWREPYERRLAAIGDDAGGQEGAGAALRAKASRGYLTRLARLRRYVETTRLVDGDETRQVLLDRLTALRDRLQQSPRV
ncbi:hypothetical protein ABN028_32765 [Actinopolymorpha sp. B17G11]|uniref:hypothetical protein n=1 Tax=Actinopolymorpha sp. B17G11 TaxID=3160861 RepID=UPI0032E3E333